MFMATFLYVSAASLCLATEVNPIVDRWLDQDTWETMTPEKEAEFIQKWDQSFDKGLATGPGGMLWPLLVREHGVGQFDRLRYNNPAIIDRVVTLYIAECQYKLASNIRVVEHALEAEELAPERASQTTERLKQARERLTQSRARDGNLLAGVPMADPGREGFEAELEYHDQLGPLAVSTLSPKLYDYLWYTRYGSNPAFPEYFKRVNGEKTLIHLSDALVGKRPSYQFSAGFAYLYRADGGGVIGVDEAFDYGAGILSRNSELAPRYRDSLVELVRKSRNVYWRPADSEFNKGYCLLDYKLRAAMLRVLAEIGTSDDVPLVISLQEHKMPYDCVISKSRTIKPEENPPIEELVSRTISAIKSK